MKMPEKITRFKRKETERIREKIRGLSLIQRLETVPIL